MTFLNQSLSDKKTSILQSMADGYSKSIQSQISGSCNQVLNEQSQFIIDCDTQVSTGVCPTTSGTQASGDMCVNCIGCFYGAIYTNTPAQNEANISIINQYRNGVCKDLCSCTANKIDISNTLNVTNSCKIDTTKLDIDKIVSSIVQELQTLTGQTVSTDDIQSIVVGVNDKIVNDTNQTISDTQVIQLSGHGSMSGITIKDVSNIAMKAI